METNKSFSPLHLISVGFALIASFQPSNSGNTKHVEAFHGGFKGMFVFGSSVVDNGNNNYLISTMAKANYKPYGIDFSSSPTGRFSNGKTIADLLGDHLKLPLIPAFSDPNTKGNQIIHGVNYGSGGSGILENTGFLLGGVMSMNQQIEKFRNVTLPELESLLESDGNEILSDYLFLVAAGNNDYGLNYFLDANKVTPEAFTATLLSNYSDQLKTLYNVGARNFLLLSVYPLGCNPWIREYKRSINGCDEASNLATKQFHTQLVSLVDRLKPKLPGSEFLVVNTYNIITDIINHPLPKGFQDVSSACCELKPAAGNLKLACKEGGNVCPNRDSYVFFDGQHNTQAVNAIIAAKAYNSPNKSEIYPISVEELARCRLLY